jgi:spore photoproduct lyase
MIPKFDQIFIDNVSRDSQVSKRVQSLYPADIIQFVDREPYSESKGTMTATEYDRSKRQLFLTEFKGHFFKRCPGATQKKSLTCCNYHVLNLGSQCNMNCSYCYLQSYLNSPVMKVFTNIDKALEELKEMAELHPNQPFRVGTGEVIDSLSLDEVTLYSRQLIAFFKNYPNWILEFKTKSNKVDQFLDIPGAKNIVVSWSINPPAIIDAEEHGTARFHERIEAAKKCRDKGYRIAFHIDPMIWHPEWKKNYSYLAEELNRNFSAAELQTITLGTLRFQPEQKQMMRERFGMKSLVSSAEMFPSEGNKLRYDANLRREMFQHMQNELRRCNPALNVTLCMETPETWINTFDKLPSQMPELKEFFKALPEVQ